ncbi:hypothetical protein [Pseudobdellovibrio exovorus]|uniref:Uncharacterized protein n=1 Tax=Pseudobdellovibrio exovorus JSS TaxID=1184267 RepID=M4VBT8_9BACT|nr:hypothetical protein [Pseudobdellovibrio exovorus]AGH96698.1 hypothetical protein A11Q_2482 [Pseudobdellovibrio exovorus JSS]
MKKSENKNSKSTVKKPTKNAPNLVELNQQVATTSHGANGEIGIISSMTEDEKFFVDKIKSMFQPQTEEQLHYALFENVVAK